MAENLVKTLNAAKQGGGRRHGFSLDLSPYISKFLRNAPESYIAAIEPPFVVVNGVEASVAAKQALGTIRRAVGLLKKDFFALDPKEVVEIWLFANSETYLEHTLRFYGHSTESLYGFYSRKSQAIVVNLSTGGGTLVHEIVHPFIESNFPSCPPWFDEGLASLFECPAVINEHLLGLVNWRLPILKNKISQGGLPAFAWLTSRTCEQFYSDDQEANYAQARYLCYFLQQCGLLVRFYHQFHETRTEDPTGYKMLLGLVGANSGKRFDRDWSDWIFRLEK